ncbi:flavin monoamine oxidase family protein [Enterovibrio sp. FF113]|uniref:flavin monoamine oxidase family protein n=1 Tax=Enterovibrio sp. FF113 TaxID=3230010 RepID=UPI00352D4E2B
MKTHTVIVGGGLSGLYAAYLLEQQQEDYVLIEARNRFGGRVLSTSLKDTDAETNPDARIEGQVDLGPSWFWPTINPRLADLVKTFQLRHYKQFSTGAYQMESQRGTPPQSINLGYEIMPDSHRIEGGMGALVEALMSQLPAHKLQLECTLTDLARINDNTYRLTTEHKGVPTTLEANCIIFAMPLRLVSKTIAFSPPMSPTLQSTFNKTETWMASHAKAVFVYDTPFWRGKGLSGSASSRVGPLAEIHDATPEMNGNASYGALMGFMGVNGPARKTAGDEVLRKLCLQQLERIFGPEASNPITVHYVDWFQNPYTATNEDQAMGSHSVYGFTQRDESYPNVFYAGTEAAREFGGYLEGALEAAQNAVLQRSREKHDK